MRKYSHSHQSIY